MHSAALLAKDSTGRIVPFQNNEKVRFIDGSFTADIPRKRLSELFHVTQDIVSQVNPHVVAWLDQHAEVAAQFNVFRRLESTSRRTSSTGCRASRSCGCSPPCSAPT